MSEKAREANFDGLVGPTHNYAGLSYGNTASARNEGAVARPRAAALQGLDKMLQLAELGLVQGVLPPHDRPHVPTLRRLGFTGTDEQIVERAATEAPALLRHVCSASPMWTANAATVSPSADTDDGRVHMTPANLAAKFHRAIEHPQTERLLSATFPDRARFAIHAALEGGTHMGDEGAANHTRLASEYGARGLEIFVYGRRAFGARSGEPTRFPARQTREASEAVARLHGLSPEHVVFAQQNPGVIDAGVFHNDVISVGNLGVLLYHEDAFVDGDALLTRCREALGDAFTPIVVPRDAVPVDDAIRSYLFNTQLVRTPDGVVRLIAPAECAETPSVSAFLDAAVADNANPIQEVRIVDLRQSMRNGGGPACLRLRVVLTDVELAAVNRGSLVDAALHSTLTTWVERNYREELTPDDLRDPHLVRESRTALDEITQILGLGSVYEFQN